MIKIILNWPPSFLSPNHRNHWTKTAKAKKLYRNECFFVTLSQISENRIDAIKFAQTCTHMDFCFCAPNMRKYDKDNLLARMKSGIDGMCDALKINDNAFTSISVHEGPIKRNSGIVQITLY